MQFLGEGGWQQPLITSLPDPSRPATACSLLLGVVSWVHEPADSGGRSQRFTAAVEPSQRCRPVETAPTNPAVRVIEVGTRRDGSGCRDRALPPEPGQFSESEGSIVSENITRAELFAALQALAGIVPEMRSGQIMAAVGELCADLHGRGLWDAADAELLEAVWQFRRGFEAATVAPNR